jgi:quercetin dioxygenase-like cupin family protein
MQPKVSIADLPLVQGRNGPIAGRFLLEGARFGLDHLTVVLGELAPGQSVGIHFHEYEELFIIHGGRGTFTLGATTVEAGPGDVVLIPTGVPHGFTNHTEETWYLSGVAAAGRLIGTIVDTGHRHHQPSPDTA